MGGMQGFGPVVVPGGEASYHERWEPRVFALSTLVGFEGLGKGGGRPIREEMAPEDYLRASYYERWLGAPSSGCFARGRSRQARSTRWVERLGRASARRGGRTPSRPGGRSRRSPRPSGWARRPTPVSASARASASGACGPRAYALPALRARGGRRGRGVRGVDRLARHRALPGSRRAGLRGRVPLRGSLRGRRRGAWTVCSTSTRATWSPREHDTTRSRSPPSPPVADVGARRCARRRSRRCWSRRGSSRPTRSTPSSSSTRTTSARRTAPGSSHAPGSTRPSGSACSRDGAAAIAELGFGGARATRWSSSRTRRRPQRVVCTLCSCYPWPVLGLPPTWYKSAPYRARVVAEPRAVLREFGLELADDVEIRVWDSTAEVRYLVLPERPAGTEAGREEELAALVTRDSMIGTARASEPERAASVTEVGDAARRQSTARSRRRRRCRAERRARVRGAVAGAGARHDRRRARARQHPVGGVQQPPGAGGDTARLRPGRARGGGVLRRLARRARGDPRRSRSRPALTPRAERPETARLESASCRPR